MAISAFSASFKAHTGASSSAFPMRRSSLRIHPSPAICRMRLSMRLSILETCT